MTALGLKLATHGGFSLREDWHQTKPWLAFAYLVTVLMFARVDLYADRPRRPGFGRIAGALFQGTVIALVFALANGQHFQSYWIFYGSLVFGTRVHHPAAGDPSAVTGWLLQQAGYQRRAVLVGSGATSRPSPTRWPTARARRSSSSASSRCSPGPTTGCARSASWPTCRRSSPASASRRSSSPTPTSRRSRRWRSSTSATSAG